MRSNLTAHAALLGENAYAEREITYLDPPLWSIPNDNNISGFEIAMSPVIFVQNLETLKKLADDYLVVLLFQFSSDLLLQVA